MPDIGLEALLYETCFFVLWCVLLGVHKERHLLDAGRKNLKSTTEPWSSSIWIWYTFLPAEAQKSNNIQNLIWLNFLENNTNWPIKPRSIRRMSSAWRTQLSRRCVSCGTVSEGTLWKGPVRTALWLCSRACQTPVRSLYACRGLGHPPFGRVHYGTGHPLRVVRVDEGLLRKHRFQSRRELEQI